MRGCVRVCVLQWSRTVLCFHPSVSNFRVELFFDYGCSGSPLLQTKNIDTVMLCSDVLLLRVLLTLAHYDDSMSGLKDAAVGFSVYATFEFLSHAGFVRVCVCVCVVSGVPNWASNVSRDPYMNCVSVCTPEGYRFLIAESKCHPWAHQFDSGAVVCSRVVSGSDSILAVGKLFFFVLLVEK